MHQAKLYRSEEDVVVCELCAHHCRIKEGRRGLCRVRENRGGTLYTLVYGKVIAENVDPIEKKPLFHVLPGSLSYSIATRGCNFRCLHCQNHAISQVGANEDPAAGCRSRSVADIVAGAQRADCRSISYTYVEPTIFFEFALECAKLASERGLLNVFVSNGYLSAAASRSLAPYLAAINIDIKSFRDEFYQRFCGARLQPVLESVQLLKSLGVWVEVTTLLIPGHNDSPEELQGIATFLADTDCAIPWHVTAFRPTYKLLEPPPTSRESLQLARNIGREAGLHHVYVGNVHHSGGEDTHCPGCGNMLLQRRGFTVLSNHLQNGGCGRCGYSLPGVW